jgi:hypothetical protein
VTHEQVELSVMANSIDVCFRKDEPVDLEVLDNGDTKTIWGVNSNKTIKPINCEGVPLLSLDELKIENDRLNMELSMAIDELNKYKKLYLMESNEGGEDAMRKIEIKGENEKLEIMNSECLSELKRINLNLRKNLTIKEIIMKYHGLQTKLNDSMIAVKRILKKCFDNDEFNMDEKIKEFGYVMTIPRLVDYLVSIVKLDDDYIDEYE